MGAIITLFKIKRARIKIFINKFKGEELKSLLYF